MAKYRVLVVEDDAGIRQGIVDALSFEGYETFEAADGKTGLEKALSTDLDLVLLDLVLPGMGGLDVLREVRSVRAALPVIVLTARGEEEDRVRGLRLGADDYVVKPFSVRELLARVEAVLRRSPERPEHLGEDLSLPGAKVDLEMRSVQFEDGAKTELSEREFDLLRYLASRPDRPVSRDEILSRVWRIPAKAVETRTVDMHIARLREKLRDDSSKPRLLITVRGKGYMFAKQSA